MSDCAKVFTVNYRGSLRELFVSFNYPDPSISKEVFISIDNPAVDEGEFIVLSDDDARALRDHLNTMLGTD